MKKCNLTFLALIGATLLTGCPSLAEKYDLPADPVETISVELVDATKALKVESAAVTYSRILLSDDAWAEHLEIYASMGYEGSPSSTYSSKLSVWKDGNDRIGCTHTETGTGIKQGVKVLTLSGLNSREKYIKKFPVGSGVSTDQFLGLKVSAEYTPRAPYICEDSIAYKVALSEDKKTIYVKPNGTAAATRVVSLLLAGTSTYEKDSLSSFATYARYLLILVPADMKADQWTKVPTTYCTALATTNYWTSSSWTAAAIRKDWSFQAWASVVADKDWGISIVTYIDGGSFEADVPAADIFDPLASSSRSLVERECSPMLKDLLGLTDEMPL